MDRSKTIRIHFLGAAGTVTGSKFLVDTGSYKLLIDCGLFQGLKALRVLNWEQLPVDVSQINTVLLTHGHLDHTGYLPKLIRSGFTGSVRGTRPTLDVAAVILEDSALIQEEEAEKANKGGYSKHHPAKPLYTLKDAEKAIDHFIPVQKDTWIELNPDIRARFRYNGHIIGSTFIELEISGKMFVFSGDVGRPNDLLMYPPEKPERADYLFLESTYGDRLHPVMDVESELERAVNETINRGGSLFIPSFAVERAQLLMYILWKLKESGRIGNIPMIMDSPMGDKILGIFEKNLNWHKLDAASCKTMCNAFRIVKDYKETWEIINDPEPKIVIAGSGMVGGGRILTYLTQSIEDKLNCILLSGFQAEGTRGRDLEEGASTLKMYGRYYDVKAEIRSMTSLSAHADQAELLSWLSGIQHDVQKVFIVHGEQQASIELKSKIEEQYGWACTTPTLYAIEDIAVGF